MIRRLLLFALGLILGFAATIAWSGQANKIPVVGYLVLAIGPDDLTVIACRQALRELGYVDGQNIRFEFRTARGHPDRLPGLAEELVQLKVDAIIVTHPITAQVARRATSSIPIVVALFDPVAAGLVTNLAHPGENVTGLSSMTAELYAKRLQLLKETIPGLARVAVLWNPTGVPPPLQSKIVEDLKAGSRSLSIELKFVIAKAPEEFEAAFAAISRARTQALYLLDNPVFYANRIALTKLTSKARLPTIYVTRAYVDEGGLISYGANYADQMRRAAGYIDKILKGAKPGDLPIEQATRLELVVNLKTAKILGLTIPESVLLQADEVIR